MLLRILCSISDVCDWTPMEPKAVFFLSLGSYVTSDIRKLIETVMVTFAVSLDDLGVTVLEVGGSVIVQ
jgi:hypothetical protein